MGPIAGGTGPEEVEVAFSGPEQQRRLTVAFRILLLIPHGIVLFFVAMAMYVVAIVAWFTALLLGRLPVGMANFIGGVVRYTTRVYAYGYLLTDRYPPFSFGPADYPVSVTLHPGRLNRLAVLFRIILMIPAYVVVALLGSGVGVVMFFAWLIVLVAGRMPPSLHQAIAAVLRYQARFYSYVALVSAAYPSRLFGDPPSPATEPVEPIEPPLLDAPYSSPPPTTGPPLASRLVLTPAAKRIIVAFLVLGVLSSAGSGAVAAVTAGSADRIKVFNSLNDDHTELAGAVNEFQSQAGSCSSSGGSLACVQSAARNLGGAFAIFGQQVQSLDMPAADQGDANRLVSDAQQLSGLLARMATAPTQAAYLSLAQQFQSLASTFDQDYQTLGQDLLSG